MTANWEKDLPEGYRPVYTINAANTKIGVLLNFVGFGIMIPVFLICYLCIRPLDLSEALNLTNLLIFSVSTLAYIVLHELVHGAAYKLLTKQKLTFGLTLTVAFCGVPQIYVYRRTALLSLLAPFVTFTVLFGALIAALPWPAGKLIASVLLAFHAGGCAGDLYDTLLFLTKFKNPKTLMRDTGPEQTFYLPDET